MINSRCLRRNTVWGERSLRDWGLRISVSTESGKIIGRILLEHTSCRIARTRRGISNVTFFMGGFACVATQAGVEDTQVLLPRNCPDFSSSFYTKVSMAFFCNPLDNRNCQSSTHIRFSDLDWCILVERRMLLSDCGACRSLSPRGSTRGIITSWNHTLMDVTLTIPSVAETFALEAVG